MTQSTAPPRRAGTDPTAWIEAQGAFAAALAKFQATSPVAASWRAEDVLAAAAPAHKLGFSWSISRGLDSVEVRIMHSSGWDASAYLEPPSEPWPVLAVLLGIPLAAEAVAASAAAAQPQQVADPAPPASFPTDEFEVDPIGPGVPDTPVLPEDRQPLSQADQETCVALIRAMRPEDRKAFQVEFRSHFNIPRESKSLIPHIVQVQHQRFVQRFIDELELSGVAA